MVDLGLIKGKFRRIVDKDQSLSQCIGIIAFTFDQLKPRVGSCRLNTTVNNMRFAARQTDKTAVFGPFVQGINTVYPILPFAEWENKVWCRDS